MNANPYQAPAISAAPGPSSSYDLGDPLAVRQAHIKHEASVKSIGILYYLGAIAITFAATAGIIELVDKLGRTNGVDMGALAGGQGLGMVILFTLLAPVQWFAAYGSRKLRSWGRILGIVLSAIGLLGFPVGTLINGYILYLLLCRKGQMVFSPEYKEIIALTPGVKYKTSIVVWIVPGVVVAVILELVGFAIFSSTAQRP